MQSVKFVYTWNLQRGLPKMILLYFVITMCRHMVAMQHNQWCMAGNGTIAVSVSADKNVSWQSCCPFPSHWMSLLDQLFVQNCYADLHIPSPNLPARSAPSCVLRQKHACVNEAVCCSTSSPSPSFTILCAAFSCRRLVTVAEAVTAITASASASFPHLSQQHPLHPGEHSFFTSAHPLLPLFPLDF